MESSSEELSQSLSGSQYDAQNTSEEWTIISDEENDCPEIEVDNETDQGSFAKDPIDDKESVLTQFNANNNNNDENQINENIENYAKEEEEEEDEQQIPDSTNDSSDIDVIDEEDDNSDDELSTASLCSSSVVSQTSNISYHTFFKYHQYLSVEPNNDDLSETSSVHYQDSQLGPELELNPGPRAYVHTPNNRLNNRLNLILLISVAVVIGVGIGHYKGWYNQWHNKQISLGQVLQLKQLQDELVICMQNQANKSPQIDGKSPQVCYTDNDYWRAKFQTLFSENKDLLGLLEKTQKHYHLNGNTENILSDKECVNKSTSDEFHNLKLGFLVHQMEHLKLLKALEEVQHKGRQSEKRVQDLEVENSKLKMKLVEEEEDDEVIVQSWGNKVRVLEDENKELQKRLETDEEEDSIQLKRLYSKIDDLLAENNDLKTAIGQLEAQVDMVDQSPSTVSAFDGYSTANQNRPSIKLDLLKQKINQMVIENDELKSTIARLRWASNYHQNVEEYNSDEEVIEEEVEDFMSPEDISQLEDQLNQMKDMLSSEQSESKKWREMYEKLKKEKEESIKSSKNNKNGDTFDENVIYDWVLNSTNVLKEALVKGSGVVGTKLKEIFDKLTENDSIFSDDISMGINATQTVFYELNRRLQNKWQELQDLKGVLSNGNKKISNKMSKLLERTVRKLQDAGNKLLSKEERLKSRVDAFSNRISKLISDLDNKWNNLLNKLSDRYSKQQKSSEDNYENSEPKINWFFERAKSRRQHQTSPSDTETDGNRKSNIEFNRVVIEDSDVDQFSDSGVEEEGPKEENWFLRKAKKPKINNDFEFERPNHKSRRNSYRTKQEFAQKFDYSSRQR